MSAEFWAIVVMGSLIVLAIHGIKERLETIINKLNALLNQERG